MKKVSAVFLVVAGLAVAYIYLKNPEAVHDKEDIMAVLNKQVNCWNKGDINCFMEGYWKSDSLMFIGSSGITYGYQNTMDRYKKNYPDTKTMGELSFDIMQIMQVTEESYLVVGKFHLKRDEDIGDLSGTFTLTFRKVLGDWLVVADHTAADS